MAAIVYLDVDDEITSAAARLRTLEDQRIALVLPVGSRVATSRINFRLLAREAAARSKALEIVTGDASARALAASAGLPTHVSVAAFEGASSGPPAVRGDASAPSAAIAADRDGTPAPGIRPAAVEGSTGGPAPGAAAPPPPGASRRTSSIRSNPAARRVPSAGRGPTSPSPAPLPGPWAVSADDSPTVPMPLPTIRPPAAAAPVPRVGRRAARPNRVRWAAAALVAVIVLVVAGFEAIQLLPSATIAITPGSTEIGPIELNVTAQTGITKPDPTLLLVPATRYTFDLQASDTFQSTGVKVDETAAIGEVSFENCDTGGPVTIPAGSAVGTNDGVLFLTQASITLKRAHVFPFGCEAGSVAVTAKLPGLSGNVLAGTITRIPAGYDSIVLRVTNAAPTSGGTHSETKQVAQADIDAAMTALTTKLSDTFDAQIAAATGVPAGTTLFATTKSLGTATPTVDPTTLVGTLSDTFDLGLTASGSVVGVDPAPVRTLADARVRSSVPDGYSLVEDSIAITVGTPIVAGSTITFPVTASAVALHQIDLASLRTQIRGKGLPQARAILEQYGSVALSVWPDWVTTIPTNDSRVTLTLSAPAASPGASQATALPGSTGPRITPIPIASSAP
jgi:hypothetical protein